MAKSLDAKTVEKAAKKVLKKASGELMKLSKVQAKVRERLFKDNPHITEQETHQLLAEVLQTSRSFAVDGKKVRLAAEPVPVAAATDVKAETVAALVRDDKVDHKRKRVEADEQQQTQGKQKKHKHKHLKQEEARLQQAHQQDEQAASQQQQPVPDKAPGSSQQQQLQQQEPEQKKHKHKGKDKHKDKKHKEIKVESQGTLVTAAHNTQQDTQQQQQQQQPEPSKHKKHGKDERNHNKHKVIKIKSQGTPATADNNTQQQSEPDQLKNHGKEKHRDKHKHKAIKAEVMDSPSAADGTAKQEKQQQQQQQQQLPQSKDKDKQKTKVPHAVSQNMPVSDQLEKRQQQQLTTPRAAGPRDQLQQTTPGPLLSKPQALKAITPAKQQQQRVSTPAAAEGTARANLLQTVQALQQRKPAGVRHTVLTPAAAANGGATAAAVAAVQAKRASQLREVDDEVQRQTRARRSDTWRVDFNRTDVKHGKFTDAEKEAIHEAIVEFADEKGLPHEKGECGWLVDRKTADLKRGVITAIAAAVPHRTRKAVWQFVQSNYTPIEVEGPFSPEEDEKLLQLFEELGPRWKEIGQRMGRLDRTVRDRAKTLNYGKDKNRGRWSQEEIDMLSSLVSAYAQALATAAGADDEADDDGEANGDADAAEGAETAAGAGSSSDVRRISKLLLPDEHTEPRPVGNVTNHDVDWEWVSSQMEARTAKQCAERWHHIQSPGMIESGQWAPGNDSTMVAALAAAAPQEEFQVDWGKLVPGRNAQQCKRRWKLILRHLPVEVRNNFSAAVAEAANRMQRKQKKRSKAGNRTEGDADGGGGGEAEAAAGQ